jgi:hypothetical protein
MLESLYTFNILIYTHASQLTFTTAHSIDIDMMVAISLFGGSTHLSVFNDLTLCTHIVSRHFNSVYKSLPVDIHDGPLY